VKGHLSVYVLTVEAYDALREISLFRILGVFRTRKEAVYNSNLGGGGHAFKITHCYMKDADQ
jgi:hypothetical protein